MQDPYDRCTERVRLALALARDEARSMGERAAGPEHLLLGLLRERGGVAAQALRSVGLEEGKLRWAIAAAHGRAPAGPPPRPARAARWSRVLDVFRPRPRLDKLPAAAEVALMPAAREVLQRALADVQRLDHHLIATEHLLLQLVRDEGGTVAAVLRHLEVTPAAVRDAVQDVIARAAHRRPAI